MRMTRGGRRLVLASAAGLIGAIATVAGVAAATGAAAPAKPSVAAGPPLLLPVSDADSGRAGGSGCESWFTRGDTGYTFMRADTFMLRVAPGRAGLKICRLTDGQSDGFGDNGKTLTCGGRQVTVRRVGRVTSHAEADSADFPATLTVGDGRRTTTLRGRYGTAC